MIESLVLGGIITLFKAAFAGDDLDRKVGAQVIGSVIDGLLRTTSAADPVLLQVHRDVMDLKTAPYEQAMASGHRYLDEARLSPGSRSERLNKARDHLVHAASAAEVLDAPLLIANAEFAIAKCDVLLAAPAHADMALRKASTALESAIAKVDMNNSVWLSLKNAQIEQGQSVGKWFERLTGPGLVKKTAITAAEETLVKRLRNLEVLTDLYSEVQTAVLAAGGSETPVVWGQPAGASATDGFRDNALAYAHPGQRLSGFGIQLEVQRQVLWRPDGELVVDLLLWVEVLEERILYCRADIGVGTPIAETENPAVKRALDSRGWLIPPDTTDVRLAKGAYSGWLRIPAHGTSLDSVTIRPCGVAHPHGLRPTKACIRVPITG